ncbi:MAG: hypothetical protein ACJ762_04355 [Solirubrobacteraceae bacterium]
MSPARLTALGGLVAALALAGPAAAAKPKPKPIKTCNGAAALCDRAFDQVVLAGTHNSMSSATSHFNVPNQQIGIPAQLKMGIRGFLIDTYLIGTKVYLCHIACSPSNGQIPLTPVLAQIAAFLETHPGDVVMFVNEDHTSAADFVKAVEKSPLKHYLYRGATGPWPTLRQMAAKHQQVVMTAESDVTGAAPWYHPAYTGIVQETPYSWPDETVLTDPARQLESCVGNRGVAPGTLFLMNHWSPPFGANPEAGARVNAKDVIVSRATQCAAIRGKLPTLIAVDEVLSGDVVGAVRQLNGL